MPTRRERIEAMLADEPHDLLLRYGLAVEWEKEKEIDRALQVFAGLIADTPPYVPAFFRAGQMLAGAGRIAEARDWLRRGIESARLQGDRHAAGEMSEFLASLGALGE